MADGTREPGPDLVEAGGAQCAGAVSHVPPPPPPPIPRGSEAPRPRINVSTPPGAPAPPSGGEAHWRTEPRRSSARSWAGRAARQPSRVRVGLGVRAAGSSPHARRAAPPRPASGLCRPSAGPQVPSGRLARHSAYASGRRGQPGRTTPAPVPLPLDRAGQGAASVTLFSWSDGRQSQWSGGTVGGRAQ